MGTEWIDRLKAGDEVIVKSGYGHTSRRLAVVDRLTATQVVVTVHERPVRYWKDGGQRIGGDWSQRIEEVTQARRDEVQHEALVDKMASVKWRDLPLATLEAICSLIEKRTPAETSKP